MVYSVVKKTGDCVSEENYFVEHRRDRITASNSRLTGRNVSRDGRLFLFYIRATSSHYRARPVDAHSLLLPRARHDRRQRFSGLAESP